MINNNQKVLLKKNIKFAEIILGLGLGLGYMTSLRFYSKIGIGELLILIFILIMFLKYYKTLLLFEKNFAGFIKLYTGISIFIVLPIVTFVVYFFTDLNSSPIDIVMFMMGWLIIFLLIKALNENFDMKIVIIVYAISFLSSVLISYFFFPSYYSPGYEQRFMGFASDPNQLMFYVANLSLMLAIYHKKLLLLALPITIWIGYITKSDSYYLQLFTIIFLFVLYSVLFGYKIKFRQKLTVAITLFLFILILLNMFYSDFLIEIWNRADEGNARLGLLYNGFLTSLHSPFVGFGAGSFSDVAQPFGRWESHNAFLDYSMQLGFIFPILIYTIFFWFLIKKLKHRAYLEASFMTAFLISGLFHYNGRHFIFWVEIAVFYYFVFYSDKKVYIKDKNR